MENGKISISTILLVIAIIIIAIMGAFIYKLNEDKMTEVNKSNELQAQVNGLNETLSDLQGKIGTISNMLNDNTSVENNTTNSNNDDISIQGTYAVVDVNHEYNHGYEYVFSGNKVVVNSLDTKEGSFQIEGNTIKITYTKYTDPDGNIGEYDKEEELKIEDENTLTYTNPATGYITKYTKK